MSNDVAIGLFGANGYDRVAQGVAGAGRRLAAELGGKLHALVLGPIDEPGLAALGGVVDSVVIAGQAELAEYQPDVYLAALEQLALPLEPAAILLGGDFYSQELTPRLAHRLGGASMADAAAISVHDGTIRAPRTASGGKAIAVDGLKLRPAVVWTRARSMEPAQPTGAAAPVERRALDLPAPVVRIVERIAEEQEGGKLEDADVIVSGGRGLGGSEPFEDLKALAKVIGAENAASRAACDAGWVPPNWQVGQTGKKVAPELYLAIAISGASQHLLGMGDSKVIAAINTDAEAPIFKHCSFGIVEDYKKVVPLLTEKLKELVSR
ncbi:MAG TPA: electron transfer flavoprotein subunit alpha/FixB family protein [Thermoanaerobaculia bacterium]|nr:electron transfer flavoprotein subunit alpha/FixB family protein [Thermoanaerobaculia bacterium]